MKSHLKVKVYSLSHEMTYIRRQEEKWKTKARIARAKQKEMAEQKNIDSVEYAEKNFWSQRWHRIDLKREARTTHLAYGAMRNIPYSAMEVISYGGIKGYNCDIPDWEAIAETVERFSKDEPNQPEIMQRFSEWLADAKKWFEGNPDRIKAARLERKAMYEAQKQDPAYRAAYEARAQQARERGLATA